MEALSIFSVIISLAFLILWIAIVVKFFQLCQDTREIKDLLIQKTNELASSHHNSENNQKTQEIVHRPISQLPTEAGETIYIGSFGKCTFIEEKPNGIFNFKAENGRNVQLRAKDVLELGKI